MKTPSTEIRTSSTRKLNHGLHSFFSEFVLVSLRRPAQAAFFARTVLWQGKAASRRTRWVREGLQVLPIAIFSITNRCKIQ